MDQLVASVPGDGSEGAAHRGGFSRGGRGDGAALVEHELCGRALWRLAVGHDRSVLHADADGKPWGRLRGDLRGARSGGEAGDEVVELGDLLFALGVLGFEGGADP